MFNQLMSALAEESSRGTIPWWVWVILIIILLVLLWFWFGQEEEGEPETEEQVLDPAVDGAADGLDWGQFDAHTLRLVARPVISKTICRKVFIGVPKVS